MLGLPKSTELNKLLPKKAIYAKFQMNAADKRKIDADISRITIVNEVSSENSNIPAGEKIKSFFVLHVLLKKKDFDRKNIITIAKLIPQSMLFLLEYENEAELAVYHTKLIETKWSKTDELSLELNGITLDKVWENIIIQISGINVENGNTLDEQIAIDEKRKKLQKEIERLEKRKWAENQPKKKFVLFQQIEKLQEELEKLGDVK